MLSYCIKIIYINLFYTHLSKCKSKPRTTCTYSYNINWYL